MSRESWKTREARRIATVNKYAAKRAELKAKGDYEALALLPRDASPVRVKKRCNVTGRASGYMRVFGLSRQTFREMAHRGLIPGVRKASW